MTDHYGIVGHCPVCNAPIYGPDHVPPPSYGSAGTPAVNIVRGCDCHFKLRLKLDSEAAEAWNKAQRSALTVPDGLPK
jgi:hypothetical protein